MNIKLCEQCTHSYLKTLPTGKMYRCCLKLKEEKPFVICINERAEQGNCGPEAKFWERK